MNRKIRWGILSTSHIAQSQVIPAIQASSNGEVVAIASRDVAKARECAARMSIPYALGSYEALLNDARVDAIYNPLPIAMHAEWSIRCAEAGKPTLCEKPLAANAHEAMQMKRAFATHNVLLGEAIMYHFHPLTQQVAKLVRSGVVGTVRALHATFHCTTLGDGNIRFQKALGGGALLDLGCYCVSVMRLLTAEEPDKVTGFCNLGGTSQVDETFQGLLHFPSGALGNFSCSLRTCFDCHYEIAGSQGRLLIDTGGMAAWPGEDFTIKLWSETKSPSYQEIVVSQANPYQLMVEDFADALLHNRPLTVPIDESIRNLQVLDRLMEVCEVFESVR